MNVSAAAMLRAGIRDNSSIGRTDFDEYMLKANTNVTAANSPAILFRPHDMIPPSMAFEQHENTPTMQQFHHPNSRFVQGHHYAPLPPPPPPSLDEPDEGSSEDIWDLDSNTVRRYSSVADAVAANNGGNGVSSPLVGDDVFGYRANNVDQINQSKSHNWSNAIYANNQHGFPSHHHGANSLCQAAVLGPEHEKWTYKSSEQNSNSSTNSSELKKPKSYQCDACDKWFTSSGHLKRHFNTTLHKNAIRHRSGSGGGNGTASPSSERHTGSPSLSSFQQQQHNLTDMSSVPSYADLHHHHHHHHHSISKYNSTSPNERTSLVSSQCITSTTTAPNVPNNNTVPLSSYYNCDTASTSSSPSPVKSEHATASSSASSPFELNKENNYVQRHNHHPADVVQQSGSSCIYDSRPSPNLTTNLSPFSQSMQQSCHELYPSEVQQQQQTSLYQNNVSIHNQVYSNSGNSGDPYHLQYSGYSSFSNSSSFPPPSSATTNNDVTGGSLYHSDTQGTSSSIFSTNDTSSPFSLPEDDFVESKFGDPSPTSLPPSQPQTPSSKKEKQSGDVGEFRCNECNKTFNRICYLKQHNKSFHNGEKPYKCGQCGKRFPVDILYQEHLAKHAGDKPYKCEVCPKQFNHKTDLRRHMCLHTGEKPFTCDVCGKGFIREDRMIKHSDTHKKKQSMLIP